MDETDVLLSESRIDKLSTSSNLSLKDILITKFSKTFISTDPSYVFFRNQRLTKKKEFVTYCND